MKDKLLLSITINVLLLVLLILSLSNTSNIAKENTELFEYVDASKSYNQAKEDFDTYTKNYDDVKKYKSEYFFRLQKSQERFAIIKSKIYNEYY